MAELFPRFFVVDDDESVRRSLRRLIKSAGYDVETFESANECLAFDLYDGPCCLVLDVHMPGLTGLDLQEELNNAHLDLLIIFNTGHGDIPMSVKAMKADAVDFLPKPFEDQQLLDAVHQAIEKHKVSRQERAALAGIEQRIASLTPREYQVFALMIAGLLNRQIAAELGVTERTVMMYRARMMQKMEVVTLAELVRLAERVSAGEVVKRVASLTPREYQVFALVITGLLNKQIAAELGVTEKTVKAHRARVMQKIDAAYALVSLVERVNGISVEGNLITGEVVNVTGTNRDVPKIIIEILDKEQRVIDSWLVTPANSRLGPGESTTFSDRITDLPKNAVQVMARLEVGG